MYGSRFAEPQSTSQTSKGETVRINKWKGSFEKGYAPNWVEEHFRVAGTIPKSRRVYKLEDLQGEAIEGGFYKEEIQPVSGTNYKYTIDKLLGHRGSVSNGSRESLVKWRGWPEKFNSWVPDSEHSKYNVSVK